MDEIDGDELACLPPDDLELGSPDALADPDLPDGSVSVDDIEEA